MKTQLLTLLFLLILHPAFSQSAITVTGTVKDASGEALPGVNVLIKGTKKGTSTDIEGKYKLDVPSKETVLVFSFIGYQAKEEKVAKRAIIDVTMDLESASLEEIVIAKGKTGLFKKKCMGDTTGRYFRDKLAMRMKAKSSGIAVPAFSPIFNDEDVNHFADTVPAPWLVKPRSEASATGIKKAHNKEELWQIINDLGDRRHKFLVERFAPGDVYHVDSLSHGGKIVFTRSSKYVNTPMEVAHEGGIFRSATVKFGSDDEKALQKINKEVMKSFGMVDSASHSEYIKSHETGELFFLETSARVGGAHLAEMVEASSGINLWKEWARLETALARGEKYEAPKAEKKYSGIIISLSRFQNPDQSVFTEPEIWWRMEEEYHVGLIIQSDKQERVLELLDKYAEKIYSDFHASAPVPDKPTH